MAKRLIKEGILVARNGKRITPEIGKVFDLTAEEISDLERIRPQAIAKIGGFVEDSRSKPVDDNADSGGDINLEDMTRAQLVGVALARGVEHAKNASREKIIAALVEAESGDDGL